MLFYEWNCNSNKLCLWKCISVFEKITISYEKLFSYNGTRILKTYWATLTCVFSIFNISLSLENISMTTRPVFPEYKLIFWTRSLKFRFSSFPLNYIYIDIPPRRHSNILDYYNILLVFYIILDKLTVVLFISYRGVWLTLRWGLEVSL